MTALADVQRYMREMTERHGFTTDPHTQMTLITEEIGELARVVKLVARGHLDADDPQSTGEFADVLITLAGLANILGVDLDEAFDESCEQAHRDYQRTWCAAARSRDVNLPPCTECGGVRKPRQAAHGWCRSCYGRWLKAGRPDGGPAPRGEKRQSPWAGRREDYRWLRSSGETVEAAAQRIGIAARTARKWEVAA